jgi:LmbE family N-acetylglucosaminyl deacetylase
MRLLAVALLPVVLLFFTLGPARGQRDLAGPGDIVLRLEKLNVLGSVLMIAAHPDDENNPLLAYLARGRRLRTAYLSATRGEGGQNLIGPERGDLLGVIRTQELLAARRIDGAEQFFTRAIDFGFSKTPEETLAKWGRERILSDIVWTIRHYQPDVIVLQFSGTPRDGHGQHQASAILGKEAYFAAADKDRFPEQHIAPWKAKRLMHNARARGRNDQIVSVPGGIAIQTGEYSPLLGKSFTEIAGISRSEHRSQGQGSAQPRGSATTFLTTVAGDPAATDIFDGVDITWNRVPGGGKVGQILKEAAQGFSAEHPDKTIPMLLKARPLIARSAGSGSPWAKWKLEELDEAIAACAGLWVDATADRPTGIPGSKLEAKLSAIDRAPFPLTWLDPDTALPYNQIRTRSLPVSIPADQPYSQPFWLEKPNDGNAYTIDRQELRDLPENPPYYQVLFRFAAGSEKIELRRPLHYRYVDVERGEMERPVAITPPAAVNLTDSVFVFPNGKPHRVLAQVQANVAQAAGEVRLEAPDGWKVVPPSQTFRLGDAGEQADLSFEITPGARAGRATIRAIAGVGGRRIASGMRLISYPHIPIETTFPPAEARAESFPVVTLARKIGYIMGSGDDVPRALEQLGCAVTMLGPDDVAARDLSEFDAIVTGVRAYNERADLRANQSRLLRYVQDGGTLVVQYNYAQRDRDAAMLSHLRIGPYPLKFDKDRTTMEEAPVSLPNPDNPLVTVPNKITPKDFEGWVQERGLYYASQWDSRYQPVFESHDPGDKAQLGSTLYTRYGKGVYIFTAFSWFRQLPAGVPGAYRIFANMVSASKAARP